MNTMNNAIRQPATHLTWVSSNGKTPVRVATSPRQPEALLAARRVSKLASVLMFSIMTLAAGCGGGGSAGDGGASDAGSTTATGATNVGSDPAGAQKATYAVVVEFELFGRVAYHTAGTAFAIAPRRLATNSHITDMFIPKKRTAGSNGIRITNGYAIQSGTGKVVKITRAVSHPDWNGIGLASPDVGLLATSDTMDEVLALANDEFAQQSKVGDSVLLPGFPGDVNEFIRIEPGKTVPIATSLSGTLTAARNFSSSVAVTAANTDVFQHQAPTSPGTSGSAILRSGQVIAVNNAGTVQMTFAPDGNGGLRLQRTPAASNNFGIHVKWLRNLLATFDDNSVVGVAVPPEGTPFTGHYTGSVDGAYPHTLRLTFDEQNNALGTSEFGAEKLSFTVTGSVQPDGSVTLSYKGVEGKYAPGFYKGTGSSQTGEAQMSGSYYAVQNGAEKLYGKWSLQRVPDSVILPAIKSPLP